MRLKLALARATGIGYRQLQPLSEEPERVVAASAARYLEASSMKLISASASPTLDAALRQIEDVMRKRTQ